MKAYKGFRKANNGRLYCRGFYYEEGKTYETDEAELCICGFHACELPIDVFSYYNSKGDVVEFHEVELEGVTNESDDDSKVCGTKITIGRKITPDEMVDLSIPMIMANKEKYFVEDKPHIIRKDDKYNFINSYGNLLREDQWFDDAEGFNYGLAEIYIKDKGWNYINTNGKILRDDLWFDFVWNFKDGFAKVHIRGKGWNFINTDGKILPDLWFDDVWDFNEGLAKVYIHSKGYNFIDTYGNILREDLWFDDVRDFDGGLAKVRISGKGWNLIREDGKILRDDLWFDDVWIFNEGLAKVYIKDKGWNYINTNGKILRVDLWFDDIFESISNKKLIYTENKRKFKNKLFYYLSKINIFK